MADRFPWEPHPEGGFIAYPEGRDHPERRARLTPWTTGPKGAYSWTIFYDGQVISDIADSKQSASDAANARWPRIIELAEAAARRSAWETNELEMIARAERGEISPEYFANEAASYENMMWVMERLKRKRPFTETIGRLVDALSREFHRRRS
jgi:hypothetical protein